MHRIDVDSREIDGNGPGKDGFTEGDPQTQIPGTVLSVPWTNDVQENLCRAIEGSGQALIKGDYTQLHDALMGLRINTMRVGLRLTASASADGGYSGTFRCGAADANSMVIAGTGGEIQRATHIYSGGAWSSRTPAGGYTDTWLACVAKGGFYVLFGQGGEIQRSGGGTTWAAESPAGGYTGDIYGACVNTDTGRIHFVGDDSEHQYSDDDGETWTSAPLVTQSGGSGVTFRATAYSPELGRLVAVAMAGFVEYSDDDGETWNEGTTNRVNTLLAVEWSPLAKCFVAIGAAGNITRRSYDGITWEDIPFGIKPDDGAFLTVHRGLFVAKNPGDSLVHVGDGEVWHRAGGDTWSDSTDGALISTPDGILEIGESGVISVTAGV